MAELLRDGDSVVLRLSVAEKAESLHGDLVIPVGSIVDIQSVDDIIHLVHGLRLPGSRWPGRFAMGTFISSDSKTFAVVHGDTKRGVRIQLKDEGFTEVLVGSPDPDATIMSLGIGSSS